MSNLGSSSFTAERIAASALRAQLRRIVSRNGLAYQHNRGVDVPRYKFSRNPQDVIPRVPKTAVPARISSDTAGMTWAIHFNHELYGRCQEVQDEPVNYDLYAINKFRWRKRVGGADLRERAGYLWRRPHLRHRKRK